MKVQLFAAVFVLALGLGACEGDGASEAGRKSVLCPTVCSFIFRPVCGARWYDSFRTFPNECELRKYNCDNPEAGFVLVCNGTCLYDNAPAPRQLRSAPLQPSSLCKPDL